MSAANPPAGGLESSNSGVLSFITSRLRQVGIFVALLVILATFQILTNGVMLSPTNVANLITQNSYILVLAIGMVMVIIAGHIDLSVGSVAAFVGAVSAVLIVRNDWPWWAGMLASLGVAVLVGVWQGFWVAYVRIPAFIVTLAGMLIFRGLTLVVLGGNAIGNFPEGYKMWGSGFLGTPNPNQLDVLTLVIGAVALVGYIFSEVTARNKKSRLGLAIEPAAWFVFKLVFVSLLIGAITYLLGIATGHRGTPVVLIVLGVLTIGYTLVMNRSVFGRHIYAIGGNRHAADLSGVRSRMVDFWLFVNMGLLAGVAGLLFTGRLNSANQQAGTLFELDAIAASFIGGAAVQGGVGTVIGAVTGGLVMGTLNNGMSLKGLGQDVTTIIKGLVLLAAVAFDIVNKRRTGSN